VRAPPARWRPVAACQRHWLKCHRHPVGSIPYQWLGAKWPWAKKRKLGILWVFTADFFFWELIDAQPSKKIFSWGLAPSGEPLEAENQGNIWDFTPVWAEDWCLEGPTSIVCWFDGCSS
jgi:hypothetical protein